MLETRSRSYYKDTTSPWHRTQQRFWTPEAYFKEKFPGAWPVIQ
ncbi:MAG TPA: hypothetical protein VH161_03700 [Candidatus Acidoferrales bacterium]|nr:hypothetical protein [Candidatus Acidoferrales bacterium]